ncbi:MAG: flagellar export protein FliJ [Phycisphaeraceae bacterium]
MPRFQFRYQTLLDQRCRAEQQAQRDLADIMGQQQNLQEQLTGTQHKITRGKQDLRESLTGRVDLSSVAQFGRYNSHSLIDGQRLVGRLAQLQPHIDAARRRLNNATRERKALQHLHDKDLADWKRTQRLRENNALDEAAIQMHMAARAAS